MGREVRVPARRGKNRRLPRNRGNHGNHSGKETFNGQLRGGRGEAHFHLRKGGFFLQKNLLTTTRKGQFHEGEKRGGGGGKGTNERGQTGYFMEKTESYGGRRGKTETGVALWKKERGLFFFKGGEGRRFGK